MNRVRRCTPAGGRSGVILLVVISLLVLFSLVGIAFVVYAEGQANTARIWREGESQVQPDMDPELLLAYFLGQFIYDTDNPNSAMRGHSLARNMYGKPGNSVPFNGSGRIHTNAAPANDDFYNVDYTAYPWNAGRSPDQYGSLNPPYTYPDFNNLYLAAQQAGPPGNGAVLVPSFYRVRPDGVQVSLRPNTTYHTGFPPQASPSGDVKNLADSPGYGLGPNDSIWIDLGFPVMTAPDGRKFKPLFAPLVLDLDNRVNVNIHGNRNGWGIGGGAWNSAQLPAYYNASWQGYGPWEVNLEKVLNASDPTAGIEGRYIMYGNNGVQGRYDPNLWLKGPNGSNGFSLPREFCITGQFYSQTDINAHLPSPGHLSLPGMPSFKNVWNEPSPTCPATSAFPLYMSNHECDNFYSWLNEFPYPNYYNYFDPSGWTSFAAYGWRPKDRRFEPMEMEALLRYGDTGSPALLSDLFRLCPQSLASGKTRRLVTTNSCDIDRPGVSPWVWDPTAQPYQLAANTPYPTGNPIPSPPPASPLNPPANSEFSANYQALTAALGRLDLKRKLPDYPAPDANTKLITDMAAFTKAQQARQQFAKEIFDTLRRVTGAADPMTATSGTPTYNALRWLAQLSANIVDYLDGDDYMTPFNWVGTEWVFGTEMPHLVVNEAYVEIANDPADMGGTATKPYQVNVWAELLNPWLTANQGGTYPVMPDSGGARLQTPGGTAVYQFIIAQGPNTNLRAASNTLGTPDPGNTKATVKSFTAATGFNPTCDVTLVNPVNQTTSGPAGSNQGYYVLGAKATLPGTGAGLPSVTLQPKSDTTQTPALGMTYTIPGAFPAQLPQHTLLLQRLACPAMPPQTDPAQPNYNPYVTVDYMDQVPTYDAVKVDGAGMHTSTTPQGYSSTGRNQPYAADASQQKPQTPANPPAGQPANTFYQVNNPVVNPFDWMARLDRQTIGPAELLHVPGFKPHELTQQFMTGGLDPNTNKAKKRFTHTAPWFDSAARIYRFFEFVVSDFRMQGACTGGRKPGKININTVWDVETLQALCDAQSSATAPNSPNFFSTADVAGVFTQVLASRTPNGTPGPTDRPFRGYATAYAAGGDLQYPNGSGVEDTLLRSSPANPAQRLFEFTPPPYANGQPYVAYEMMNKMFQHLTTRSNVFAVWLTVGFFEVVDDSSSSGPPKLGTEVGRSQNRHIRHRMFAIVDRTALTVNPLNPTATGDYPFFMDTLGPVSPGAGTLKVPALTGKMENQPFTIRVGDQLVIDVGVNQEVITVTGVNAAANTLTANFTKAHGYPGCPITNVGGTTNFGTPGPQPRFDPRQPAYGRVVRYFNVIE